MQLFIGPLSLNTNFLSLLQPFSAPLG